MKKVLMVLFGLVLIASPLLGLAQNSSTGTSCSNAQAGIQLFLCKIGEILNTAIPILVTLGVVLFIWGVITYVIGKDEEAKKKGRDKMLWGIIGLVVIVGLWGIVRMINNTFNFNNQGGGIKPPCVPGSPGCYQ